MYSPKVSNHLEHQPQLEINHAVKVSVFPM